MLKWSSWNRNYFPFLTDLWSLWNLRYYEKSRYHDSSHISSTMKMSLIPRLFESTYLCYFDIPHIYDKSTWSSHIPVTLTSPHIPGTKTSLFESTYLFYYDNPHIYDKSTYPWYFDKSTWSSHISGTLTSPHIPGTLTSPHEVHISQGL